MTRRHLVGYTDEWSVVGGDEVTVMLSAHDELTAHVDLVRLGVGERGGRVREEHIRSYPDVRVRPATTWTGSCVRIRMDAEIPVRRALAATAFLMPTMPGGRAQIVFAHGCEGAEHRWRLGLDAEGRPFWTVVDGADRVTARGRSPLVAGAWYALAGGTAAAGGAVVVAQPLPRSPAWRAGASHAVMPSFGEALGPSARCVARSPMFIAAAAAETADGWDDCFDGKLEAPALHDALVDDRLVDALADGLQSERELVSWHLGVNEDGPPFVGSVIPARLSERLVGADFADLAGECLNAPTRCVTGRRWRGVEHDFRRVPEEYGAAHFHSDDLDDCRWDPAAQVSLPPALPSGVYALRVTGDDLVDRLPLFVRARRPSSDVALLVPTASYLAYANDHPASDGDLAEAVAGATPVLRDVDLLLHEHREWGLSCYDVHVDGSGVVHSSRRRPVLNMRPTHRYHVGEWQLPADLQLVAWLAEHGIDIDILTDDDLDEHGSQLLAPYRTVITGTHPEYTTTVMLDAVEEWLDAGGRLVYVGANGFYWRMAYDREQPWMIEVRRGHAGSRAWESGAGEVHLQSTGELAGLWRHLGRTPQQLTGVGYAAQGFDRSGSYRLLTDSRDPRAAFITAGVPGPTFGGDGHIGGGAAGQELDRYDLTLGTPRDALLIATSKGLSANYRRCVEELGFTVAGTSALDDHRARADVVYHVRPGGGAVFSTGSIAWAGALGVDPDVDRVTRNVIERFRDPAPLDW